MNYIHVMFKWEAVDHATEYEFELSSSSDFFTRLISDKVVDIQYMITDKISWESTYYWRVRTVGGSWMSTYSFTTGQTRSNVTVEMHDENQYAEGNTIFGTADGYFSAMIDKYGTEIWNSGDDNIIYYNFLDDGNNYVYPDEGFFGTQYNVALDFPYPSIEFSLTDGILWQEPNNEYAHHEIMELPWGDYMGIAHVVELGPICAPIGGEWWTEYHDEGFIADCSTNEYNWWGDHLVIWDDVTKDTLWTWSTFNHYNIMDYDSITWASEATFLNQYYDWTHINAFYFDKRDSSIYISTRNLSRITKLQYPSGDIIWNMGRESASGDVTFGHDLDFSYQHSISLTDEDNILIFDNGVYAPAFWGAVEPTSRVLEIAVSGSDGNYSASLAFEYILPINLFGLTAGNAQQLENGNYLITTMGDNTGGNSLEVTSSGDLVWEANYATTLLWRASRIPLTCPALLGDFNDDGNWNVLDIVQLSNCILSNNCDAQVNGCAGDFNGDSYWNVLDIVQLTNCVLANSCDN